MDGGAASANIPPPIATDRVVHQLKHRGPLGQAAVDHFIGIGCCSDFQFHFLAASEIVCVTQLRVESFDGTLLCF